MKYGVLSDIHGNWEAFETVLQFLEQAGVDHYLFCGDLVGYGPDPEACVQKYLELAQTEQASGVLGNHDAIFAHPELQEYFHTDALLALDWSSQQLSKKSIRTISYLPEMLQEKSFSIVHGTPRDPIREYFFSSAQFHNMYHTWKGQVLFVGHTHIPFFMQGDEQQCHVHTVTQQQTLLLQQPWRYVINPGSVGKPRDNDVRAAFGIWDSDKQEFHFLRQSYDYQKTQRKMKEAGLPEMLVENLAAGL